MTPFLNSFIPLFWCQSYSFLIITIALLERELSLEIPMLSIYNRLQRPKPFYFNQLQRIFFLHKAIMVISQILRRNIFQSEYGLLNLNKRQVQVVNGLYKGMLKRFLSNKTYLLSSVFMEVPKQMKCVVLSGPGKVELQTRPIPKPKSGEVLIKVMAAPINPSDLAFLMVSYKSEKKLPCVPGFEGSGLVVENGGGVYGWGITNKRVAFAIDTHEIGSYSQYVVANAMSCIPLDESISYEHGSMSFVNPITAVAFLDILKNAGHKSVIHTAACSQLGRMMARMFPKEGIQIIHVVRRQDQMDILKKEEGAVHVLNSEDPKFDEELTALTHKLQTKICFEAIAGNMVGRILKCMPNGSTIQVYGGLSQEQIGGIAIMDVVLHGKKIHGFILNEWIASKSKLSLVPTLLRVRSMMKDNLKSAISKQVPLDLFKNGLAYYIKNMSKGKVIFRPWMDLEEFKDEEILNIEIDKRIMDQEKMEEEKPQKMDEKMVSERQEQPDKKSEE